jgi:hypothetical protein
MIHPHDSRTHLLPGIEPAPKPSRVWVGTNADDRKRIAGYMLPREVESCRNCKHRTERLHATGSLYEHVSHHCGYHRFEVKLGAICDDHTGRSGS